MKISEKISKLLENTTIDIFSSSASEFIWGEVEAPKELKGEDERAQENQELKDMVKPEEEKTEI